LEPTTGIDTVAASFGDEDLPRRRDFEHHNGQEEHRMSPQRKIVHGQFLRRLVPCSFSERRTNLIASLHGAFRRLLRLSRDCDNRYLPM
jgi:hypothetical protein